ncbi:epoxyqueuosine reductase QueH [uncultured Cetobacterium sp.]|uniref:epoxyqueuosine reductase QueH n=1 Tax=uncultured Cetobacterium sp. TaxID=527638 RepID=UPI002604BE19|nr:epoxyqueuosine reductase QueH [uncultured Cetobacterium sp.]
MKINYELEMQKILDTIGKDSEKKLLIHSCCAPCSCAILEYLKEYLNISIYFYNPNITEINEYEIRLNEQHTFNNELNYNMDIIEGEYSPKSDFIEKIKGLENENEGGKRCYECYKLRMEATAKKAKELNFDYFSTVLSISPLKNSQWINEIGIELEEKYGIKFLKGDFKKKSRYLRSVELSKEYDLYRQDYCGCIYSKIERMEKKKLNEK